MGRELGWDGFLNARDLGGLPTRAGGLTRARAFVRCADPRFVTEAGWRAARDHGVRSVVDLRNADEIGSYPGPPGFARVEVALDGVEDVEFWRYVAREELDGSPLYYRPFLERRPDRCAAAVTALARTPPGGVLFHCGAGRDRTGLVALLLLALVDVEPAAIAADYELSLTAVSSLYARLGVDDDGPLVRAALTRHGTDARAALLATLDGFDAERYLLDAGVTRADVDAIRSRLGGAGGGP